MRKMNKRQRQLAEEAMAIVPVVINAMGRSYPGIRKRIARIDASSVAYVAICRAAQTYNPDKSKVTTYFSSAIRNAILKELAKSQRQRYDSPERVSLELAESAAKPQRGEERMLPAALESLPAQERALIASRYYGRMSVREISDSTGLAQKAVRARLKSAVELLAGFLGTQHAQQPPQPGRCCDSTDSHSACAPCPPGAAPRDPRRTSHRPAGRQS